jgi:precorrin isomerase
MSNSRLEEEDLDVGFAVLHLDEMLRAFKTSYYAAWHSEKRGTASLEAAGKAETALAEIRQLIAENRFDPNCLIGMINGIAKHGPRQGG